QVPSPPSLVPGGHCVTEGTQAFWWQTKGPPQRSRSQEVPSGLNASAAQKLLEPSHASATSHWPEEPRQTTPAATFRSERQNALLPVQLSARSHAPAASRQTVVTGLK